MEKEYPKKSWKGFIVWFVIFTIALVYMSEKPSILALFGRGKDFCLFIYLLFDLLFLLIYLTGSIYWINGVSYEEAAKAGKQARRRYAFRHLCVFLGATGVYLVYCLLDGRVFKPGTDVRNTMVAAGILCLAAICTVPIKLEMPKGQ